MSNKKFYQRGASLVGGAAVLGSLAGPNIFTKADLLEEKLQSSLMYRFANFIGVAWLKRFFENRIKKEIILENSKEIEKFFSRCETEISQDAGPLMFKGTKYKEVSYKIFEVMKAGFRLLEGKEGQPERIYYFLGDTASTLDDSISNAGDWQNSYEDNTRLFNSIQNFNFMTKYLEHFKKLDLEFKPANRWGITFDLYDQDITVDFRGEKLGINNVNFNFSTDLGPNLDILGRKTLEDNSRQTIIDYSLKGEKGEKKLTIKEMQDLLNSITEKIVNGKHKRANTGLDINALEKFDKNPELKN